MNGEKSRDQVTVTQPCLKVLMNVFFNSGEDPERGKEQQGQSDPQGTYLIFFFF